MTVLGHGPGVVVSHHARVRLVGGGGVKRVGVTAVPVREVVGLDVQGAGRVVRLGPGVLGRRSKVVVEGGLPDGAAEQAARRCVVGAEEVGGGCGGG